MNTHDRATAFKPFIAAVGLGLLSAPLLWNASYEQRVNAAKNVDEVMHSMFGVTFGICTGFVGILILGMLIDCGSGYRRRWLYVSMLMLGIWWLFLHSGYLIGIVLVSDSLFKLFHRDKKSGAG